jgi:hypothetical protein
MADESKRFMVPSPIGPAFDAGVDDEFQPTAAGIVASIAQRTQPQPEHVSEMFPFAK